MADRAGDAIGGRLRIAARIDAQGQMSEQLSAPFLFLCIVLDDRHVTRRAFIDDLRVGARVIESFATYAGVPIRGARMGGHLTRPPLEADGVVCAARALHA